MKISYIFFLSMLLIILPSNSISDMAVTDYGQWKSRILLRKGEVFMKRGQMQEALELLNRAERLSPEDTDILHKKGLTLLYLERSAEAESAFRKALQINERLPHIHHNLGLIMKRRGLYKRAIYHLQMVTLLEPDRWQGFYNLMCVYALDNDRNSAVSSLKSAIEKGFDMPELLENDPELRSLKGDEEFERLKKSLYSKKHK